MRHHQHEEAKPDNCGDRTERTHDQQIHDDRRAVADLLGREDAALRRLPLRILCSNRTGQQEQKRDDRRTDEACPGPQSISHARRLTDSGAPACELEQCQTRDGRGPEQ